MSKSTYELFHELGDAAAELYERWQKSQNKLQTARINEAVMREALNYISTWADCLEATDKAAETLDKLEEW